MDEEKYLKKSVSFPERMLTEALARADGNLSGYIQSLVDADIHGAPARGAMSPTILVELARELCGMPTALKMQSITAGRDQPELLGEILKGYVSGPISRPDEKARARAVLNALRDHNHTDPHTTLPPPQQSKKK